MSMRRMDEQAEPCESASVSNGLALSVTIVLVTSFTPSYLPCLTCFHTHCVILTLILAASYLLSFSLLAPSMTSYSSHCIVQLPAVCHSESCTNHFKAHHHTRRLLLAIILAASILIAILLIVVRLIASCSLRHAHHVMLIVSCSSYRAQYFVLNMSCRIYQHSFVSTRSVVVVYIDVH